MFDPGAGRGNLGSGSFEVRRITLDASDIDPYFFSRSLSLIKSAQSANLDKLN